MTKNTTISAKRFIERDGNLYHIEVGQEAYMASDAELGDNVELVVGDATFIGELLDQWAHQGGGATMVIAPAYDGPAA